MNVTIDNIVRSRRRTLALVVTADAKVVVRAPWIMPRGKIEAFVEKHAEWVRKKLALFSGRASAPRAYADGEEFLFRGRLLKLKRDEAARRVSAAGESLVVPAVSPAGAAALVRQWYREQAGQAILPRVRELALAHGYSYKRAGISRAERRWGSCGFRNTLNFAWKLVMAPDHVIDYVIIHELCHTVEKNHSARFWERVRAAVPDYKQKKAWFRQHRHLLV